MLKQLLKYEFKATGRIYGGLYLAILAVAFLMGVFWISKDLSSAPVAFLMFVYLALGVALMVVTLLTIIQRFTRSLLGREGYLMHTLPVTSGQLILSKLISSMVWILCSAVVLLVSFALFSVFGLMDVAQAFDWSLDVLSALAQQILSSQGAALFFKWIEWLAKLAGSILCVYTACMIGHWARKHSVPVGIAAFVVLNVVQNKLLELLPYNSSSAGMNLVFTTSAGDSGTVQLVASNKDYLWAVLAALAADLVLCGIYFAAANWLMKNKLNLE